MQGVNWMFWRIWLLMLASTSLYASPLHTGQHDVYLFGNSAEMVEAMDFFHSLEQELDKGHHPFTVILMGDMVDKPTQRPQQVQQLKAFIELIGKFSNGRLVMVPGDRDWNNSRENGYQVVVTLESELVSFAQKSNISNFYWLASNGCPGPFRLSLDNHVELIAMNTQWWNHPFDKPMPADAHCEYISETDILEELSDIIEDNTDKNVLIVGHHPIKSLGNYGGRFSVKDHLMPFPVIGSFVRAYQTNVGGVNDLVNMRLAKYREMMENVIFLHHNIIYASGHEKNQQVMRMGDNYFINSGAIANSTFAASDYTTQYSSRGTGVMKIAYFESGKVESTFLHYNKKEKKLSANHEQEIFTSSCVFENILKNEQEKFNLNYVPCFIDNLLFEEAPVYKDPDLPLAFPESQQWVNAAAGPQYTRNKFFTFWMGKHYRKDWAAPIRAEVLNIDTTFNGLTAKERGGGRQTLSLKFQSESGDVYTFRSVDKDPSKALNYKLRETVVSKAFRDQTSSQHPYGALIVSSLLDSLGILHAKPRLYVMPDAEALGPFRNLYGGMLGILEEHPGKPNRFGRNFGNAASIYKSNKLFRHLYQHTHDQVDRKEFLRARLFDIWVGDWSRHEDNWKWAKYHQNGENYFRPIPRDRDMAFTKWDGFIPSIADKPFGLPSAEEFDFKIKGFQSAVFQARHMDRFLLTGLDREAFVGQAKYIQDRVDELKIAKAVAQIPKPSFANSGQEIIDKLTQRKTDLVKYANKFYDWLNREVEIVGSTEADLFEIKTLDEGAVQIQIFQPDVEAPYFERVFNPEETKEIRVYGLGGDDEFRVHDVHLANIQVRLFGGRGKEVYLLPEKTGKLKVYDLDLKDESQRRPKVFVDHWNKRLYSYDRSRLKFNTYRPVLSLGYNSFQGLILDVGNAWIRHRWDKPEYAARHELRANISSQGIFGFTYRGRWKEIIKQWDLTAGLSLANPEYYNRFHGLGNESVIDRDLELADYYVANYSQYTATVGIARNFWHRSEFSLKTGIGQYKHNPLPNTILAENASEIEGADGEVIAIPTTASLHINLLDHRRFPMNGIRLIASLNNYTRVDETGGNYGNFVSSLEYYLSTHANKPITLGLKFGGSRGYGNIPFFHQSGLGLKSGLRGYPGNRFTGQSMFYANHELRFELLDRRVSSVPIQAGVFGFYDLGRVFLEGEAKTITNGLKSAYGIGFYLVPFTRTFAVSMALGWSEERRFYPGFSVGTFLN